jgi:4,5:9,10-diseco-3-hydroxy-5,9,17-trioxoandrosta-1(10),2-diene-4-oate hydrolase
MILEEVNMSAQKPQDQYVRVGNINTRYWVEGDKGSTVVLVHGLGGSVENWVHNISTLGQYHRVYAVDLVGFGRSDKTPLTRDLNVLVKFIKDFMETQRIEKASLVGNSLGGGLVLRIAIGFPSKVEKLVLVNNAGMGREVILDLKLCSLPIVGELLSRPSRKGIARLWRKIVFDSSLITDEFVEEGYQLGILPDAMKAFLATLRAGINLLGQRADLTSNLISKLGSITAPTLVVWGQHDHIIPVAHTQIAVQKIHNVKLYIFDHCGHIPMFEHPEEFNKLLLEFLAD